MLRRVYTIVLVFGFLTTMVRSGEAQDAPASDPPADPAAPDSAAPDSAAPDSAAPDSAAPDSAAPDAAAPDAAPANRAPACPRATFRPQLLTPPATRTPRDAHLVVGLFDGGTFTDLPAVTLERGRRSTALIREAIAPGLYRLQPDARRIWGRWNLSGVPGATPLLFGRPGVGAPPVRPQITRVERYLVASGESTRTEVRAHFQFPVPPGVVAAILYWGDDPQPDGFASVTPTMQEAVLYQQSGECARLVSGATAPPTTGTVRMAFVGRYGQVSAISEPARLGG